jgi:hypothetical protein
MSQSNLNYSGNSRQSFNCAGSKPKQPAKRRFPRFSWGLLIAMPALYGSGYLCAREAEAAYA